MTWQRQMNAKAGQAKALAEQVEATIAQVRQTIDRINRAVDALKALYGRVDRLETIRPVVQQARIVLPALSIGVTTHDAAWPEPFTGPYDVTLSGVADATLSVAVTTPEGVTVQADVSAPVLVGAVVELIGVGLTTQES